MPIERPSVDEWLREIRNVADPDKVGMILIHNGVVRGTTRAGEPVSGMELSIRPGLLDSVIAQTEAMEGISHVRVWLNEGSLAVGDDIMLAAVAGDIREHVLEALPALVRRIKTEVVVERELP